MTEAKYGSLEKAQKYYSHFKPHAVGSKEFLAAVDHHSADFNSIANYIEDATKGLEGEAYTSAYTAALQQIDPDTAPLDIEKLLIASVKAKLLSMTIPYFEKTSSPYSEKDKLVLLAIKPQVDFALKEQKFLGTLTGTKQIVLPHELDRQGKMSDEEVLRQVNESNERFNRAAINKEMSLLKSIVAHKSDGVRNSINKYPPPRDMEQEIIGMLSRGGFTTKFLDETGQKTDVEAQATLTELRQAADTNYNLQKAREVYLHVISGKGSEHEFPLPEIEDFLKKAPGKGWADIVGDPSLDEAQAREVAETRLVQGGRLTDELSIGTKEGRRWTEK